MSDILTPPPARVGKTTSRVPLPRSAVARGAIGTVMVLLVAQVVTAAGWLGEGFPTAFTVLGEAVQLVGEAGFRSAIFWSLLAWVVAMSLAVAIGVPLGVVIGWLPLASRIIALPTEILRNLPSVALIPVFILVLGTDTKMKVVLTLFATIWPILFNAMYGTRDVDPVALATARSFRLPAHAVFTRIVLPSIAPLVFAGIRVSASLALIVIVGSELVAGSSTGIGSFVLSASLLGDSKVVMAGGLIAGLMGLLINVLMTLVERHFFSWRSTAGSPQ